MHEEYLQPGSIEIDLRCLKADRAGLQFEVVVEVDRIIENTAFLPERPQIADQRHLIAAVVFDPVALVDRQQYRIVMKAVDPHPPRFSSEVLESGDDVRVDGGIIRHAGIAEFCAERLCDVPVAPKIQINSALMPRHIDTAMRDKEGRAHPPLVEQRPQIGKDSGARPFDIDAQANRARVEVFGELQPHAASRWSP